MTPLTPIFQNEAMERRYGFSRAVRCGDLLFVSGTVSTGEDGRIIGGGCMRSQTTQVYQNLRRILETGGSSPEDVIKETIFTTDIQHFLADSDARQDFYANGLPPATTGVEVNRLALPDVLVEVELIALVRL